MTLREEIEKIRMQIDFSQYSKDVMAFDVKELETLVNEQVKDFAEEIKKDPDLGCDCRVVSDNNPHKKHCNKTKIDQLLEARGKNE